MSRPRLDLQRFLRRLRPAGAPGAPAGAAVPADPMARIAAELEPVFAALAEVQARCGEITGRAEAESDQLLEAARAEARRLADEAEVRARLEATEVLAARRQEARTANAAVLVEALLTARRIEDRSRQRMPRLAEEIVDSVRRWALAPGERPGPAGVVDAGGVTR